MWPFSDNKKLDQVISQVTTLTQLTLNLGEYVMAKFEDVEAALGLLNSEVSETAAQVKKLRDEVAALLSELDPVIVREALEKAIRDNAARLNRNGPAKNIKLGTINAVRTAPQIRRDDR